MTTHTTQPPADGPGLASAPRPHPADAEGLGALWARAAAEQASRSGAPPPPAEGPGLAQAARALSKALDLGILTRLSESTEAQVAFRDLRANLRRALAAEEARRKSHVEKLQDVRRELACYARNDMGERVTGVESALEDVDALIAELGSTP